MGFKSALSILARIEAVDKLISNWIHTLELPALLQAWICFCAVLFNREGVFVVLLFVCYGLPYYLTKP